MFKLSEEYVQQVKRLESKHASNAIMTTAGSCSTTSRVDVLPLGNKTVSLRRLIIEPS